MTALAAAAGALKFTLPLLLPMAFKYVIDVLLMHSKHLDWIDTTFDRWVTALAGTLGLGTGLEGKLAAMGVALSVVFLLEAVSAYYANYLSGVAGERVMLDLRCRLFAHMQRLSHSFFDRNSVGAISSRLLNDVEMAEQFVTSALTDVWMDAAVLGFVILIVFELSPELAWLSVAVIPIYVVMITFISPRILRASRAVQEQYGCLSGMLHEQIVAAAVTKSFRQEERETERFRAEATQLRERTIERVRWVSVQQGYGEFLYRFAPVMMVSVAAIMISHHKMGIGTMVAFINYLGFLYFPLERFCALSTVTSNSCAAIERIFEFLDYEPEVKEHPLSMPMRVKRGAVAFEHVSFEYGVRNGSHRHRALRNVSLRIEGGTCVALVGRSGAGKTTLASLIPRFYDATAGRVLIDGRDVRHLSLESLREEIGFVPQENLVFSTTIRDNLRYGKEDASDAELWGALEKANLRSFVESLPGGLDAAIGSRGVKLSGGQRQRVALARAFLKDPAILLMDEATSALDSESEAQVYDSMWRLMRGRTSFLIAHRLSAAVGADLILVLDRGQLVESGSHEELLARNGLYSRLYNEQMNSLSGGRRQRATALAR